MKTNKFVLIVCLLTASLSLFGQDSAPAKEKPPAGGAPKPFVLPKKETFTLKNGIVVTLVPYGSVPKVAVNLVIRSGNIDEGPNQVWLADLTAVEIKEGAGSDTGAQIAEKAASMGGRLAVNADVDTTGVGGDVLSEYGPQYVALLGNVLTHPTLPESELARLKNNLLRGLSVAKSQSGPIANELFHKVLYQNHPYGRSFPTEEMLKSYTIADVRKFYADNYGAARTRIYVCGQFDPAAMKRSITTAFQDWQAGSPATSNLPKPVSGRVIHLVDRPNSPQATVYVGLPVIAPDNPDYVALQVTNALLGGSFASRITSNIREQKGYTYSPSSQVSSHVRDAYWVEVADVTTAVTGPSLKEIFYEIDRLGKEPPSNDELAGIKNYLAGLFVLQNSSRQGVIAQLASADIHGQPADYLSTYVQRIMAVTPADVQRIAKEYLPAEKMAVVIVGDKSKVEPQLEPFGKIIND